MLNREAEMKRQNAKLKCQTEMLICHRQQLNSRPSFHHIVSFIVPGVLPCKEQEEDTSGKTLSNLTMAFAEFSQSPAAQNPYTVAAAETCADMHEFMI
jgi:hypothetical protein